MSELINNINSPEDLKKLNLIQLIQLSQEIREFLISNIAKTGGHLGSNLGVVELTLAIHYMFNSPQDTFVWDVSHQVYTHKIITGRRDRFSTLRQLNGISGFAKREESIHDIFDAGHGGTSISAALGISRAKKILGLPGKSIVIIGDGSITNGMALEALNDAGHAGEELLVILNDNAMAISPNVGAIAKYLSKGRSGEPYLKAKSVFMTMMKKFSFGNSVISLVEKVKSAIKQIVIPGMLFEDLGFKYIGPVDGHNIAELLDTLKSTKHLNGPVLLHVRTTKGKGYLHAESDVCKFHGVAAFDIESGEPKYSCCEESYTDRFGKVCCDLAEKDDKIVTITAAMCEGTGLKDFRIKYPDRFFDVGMAEEHAVTMAAGMALQGLKPIVVIYSTFLQRAYDQIMHDICMQNLPVILAIDRAGITGEDGPTHQGAFDLSYLNTIPGLTIMAPANLDELELMMTFATSANIPVAIRYPKGSLLYCKKIVLNMIEMGKGQLLIDGKDILLIAIGSMVEDALITAEKLNEYNIGVAVINSRFTKPIDVELILKNAEGKKRIYTIEDNIITGGFGETIRKILYENNVTIPLTTIGLPDEYIPSGKRAELLNMYNLTADKITAKIKSDIKGDEND